MNEEYSNQINQPTVEQKPSNETKVKYRRITADELKQILKEWIVLVTVLLSLRS